MAQRVRKAVLPVAGLGTRFLPATKAMPKEMLTVVDRPLIQYAVEECLAAGIEEFVFVTGRNKSALEDHFDSAYELEATLQQRGKARELKQTQEATIKAGNAVFTRQQEPLGLGHAVWCARDWIGREPFAVLLPDELTIDSPNCTRCAAGVGATAPRPEQPSSTRRKLICPAGSSRWRKVFPKLMATTWSCEIFRCGSCGATGSALSARTVPARPRCSIC